MDNILEYRSYNPSINKLTERYRVCWQTDDLDSKQKSSFTIYRMPTSYGHITFYRYVPTDMCAWLTAAKVGNDGINSVGSIGLFDFFGHGCVIFLFNYQCSNDFLGVQKALYCPYPVLFLDVL